MKKTTTENLCYICGKPVRWGKDGMPLVRKGAEISVLFGHAEKWVHYTCDEKSRNIASAKKKH